MFTLDFELQWISGFYIRACMLGLLGAMAASHLRHASTCTRCDGCMKLEKQMQSASVILAVTMNSTPYPRRVAVRVTRVRRQYDDHVHVTSPLSRNRGGPCKGTVGVDQRYRPSCFLQPDACWRQRPLEAAFKGSPLDGLSSGIPHHSLSKPEVMAKGHQSTGWSSIKVHLDYQVTQVLRRRGATAPTGPEKAIVTIRKTMFGRTSGGL